MMKLSRTVAMSTIKWGENPWDFSCIVSYWQQRIHNKTDILFHLTNNWFFIFSIVSFNWTSPGEWSCRSSRLIQGAVECCTEALESGNPCRNTREAAPAAAQLSRVTQLKHSWGDPLRHPLLITSPGVKQGTKTASAESPLVARWTQCLVLKYVQTKATAPEHAYKYGLSSLFLSEFVLLLKRPQNNTMEDMVYFKY